MTSDQQWLSGERHGSQLGPLDSILRTQGHFHLRPTSTKALDTALQVSRNLFQYFSADAEIINANEAPITDHGNVISIALGQHYPPPALSGFPIDVAAEGRVVIDRPGGKITAYEHQEGLGAIFLRPIHGLRLELVIWGFDSLGLRLAARLQPMLTGVGQPDFIIVNKDCAWKGAAGVLAMGSFDSLWRVSAGSFIT